MKKTKIIYWIFTGVLAAMLGMGAVFDAISSPEALEYVTQLGYPSYLVPFLGYAKILGIIAILIPGSYRVKEWAYAGLVFDLVGAMYSHIALGKSLTMWLPIFLPMLLIAGSYVYYHKLEKTQESESMREVSFSGK